MATIDNFASEDTLAEVKEILLQILNKLVNLDGSKKEY
jgi:hypothetical protein